MHLRWQRAATHVLMIRARHRAEVRDGGRRPDLVGNHTLLEEAGATEEAIGATSVDDSMVMTVAVVGETIVAAAVPVVTARAPAVTVRILPHMVVDTTTMAIGQAVDTKVERRAMIADKKERDPVVTARGSVTEKARVDPQLRGSGMDVAGMMIAASGEWAGSHEG